MISETNELPIQKLVHQPYSDLTNHIQGVNHEYVRFTEKPTKVGVTRMRKHLSAITKTAKEMRGGILTHFKGMPKQPTSNTTKLPIHNQQILNENVEQKTQKIINNKGIKRTGKNKLALSEN